VSQLTVGRGTQLEAANRLIEELRADKAFLQAELAKTTTMLSDQRRPWWRFWG
jgi:hypothetical protein